MKKIVMMMAALLAMSLSACSQKKESKEMKKVLVAYFSASGVTKKDLEDWVEKSYDKHLTNEEYDTWT